MTGNTPYAGQPTDTDAGRLRSDVPTSRPSSAGRSGGAQTSIAARTREYLPDEYVVGSQIRAGAGGPQVTVAVRRRSATPSARGSRTRRRPRGGRGTHPDEERDEVARGLAASAALQVKQALSDADVPVAR